jgi:hypothetical protein
VIAGDYSGSLSVWDVRSGKKLAHKTYPVGGSVEGIRFVRPRTAWVSNGAATWEWDMGKDTFKVIGFSAWRLSMTPGGKFMDNGSGHMGDLLHGNSIMMPREPGQEGISLSAADPTGRYEAVAVSGVLNPMGFRSDGPGKIKIYDQQKVAEAVRLQAVWKEEQYAKTGQRPAAAPQIPGAGFQ